MHVAALKVAKGIAAAAKYIVKVSVAELLSLLPVRPQLIVHLALLGILQHIIGFVDFLEFFFGIFVTRIQIRVVFSCKFLKGPGYGVLVSGSFHAKHFIIILIGCHDSSITRPMRVLALPALKQAYGIFFCSKRIHKHKALSVNAFCHCCQHVQYPGIA